jgi:cytoskeletal protein CcmA (bactofilin family)
MKANQSLAGQGRHLGFRSWLSALLFTSLFTTVLAQTPDVKMSDGSTASTSPVTESRNVYRVGGNVLTTAPIVGDFYGVGGKVTVEQAVKGDATLAGGSVTVRAPIGDDLRVAAGDVSVESSVGGELYASAGNITLTKTSDITHAVTLYTGHAIVEGKVGGPLKIYAQKILINGELGRDAELSAEQIELGPVAVLNGALRYSSNADFKQADGVTIRGAVTPTDSLDERADTPRNREWHRQMMVSGPGWVGTTFGFVAVLAAAALFLLLFKAFSERSSGTLRAAPWVAFAAGLGVLFGTPLLAVLLLITLIGIPLGIALMMLFPLMLLAGWIVGIFAISQRVQLAIQQNRPAKSLTATLGFFALTLLLVLLLSGLPFIGSVVVSVIMLLGTGACALELSRQIRPRRGSPPSGDSGSSPMPVVAGVN